MVSGHFDPLVASLAERLAQLKQAGAPLLVLIHSAADSILPALARAQLVAGLAVVDYVCDEPGELAAQISLDQEHAERLAQLIHHVHARQRASS